MLNRTPASASRTPHARSRGDKGTLRARGMEMVLGKRATPSWGGLPEDEVARTLIHNAHTHTCWATSSAHSGASSSSRAPGGPDHGHMYTHTYIGTYVHTDIPPAHQRPLGHHH